MNTVLIRENTEGEYSGIEHEVCITSCIPSPLTTAVAVPFDGWFPSDAFEHLNTDRGRCRSIYQIDHLRSLRESCKICVPLRLRERKKQGHRRSQGYRHVSFCLVTFVFLQTTKPGRKLTRHIEQENVRWNVLDSLQSCGKRLPKYRI